MTRRAQSYVALAAIVAGSLVVVALTPEVPLGPRAVIAGGVGTAIGLGAALILGRRPHGPSGPSG